MSENYEGKRVHYGWQLIYKGRKDDTCDFFDAFRPDYMLPSSYKLIIDWAMLKLLVLSI